MFDFRSYKTITLSNCEPLDADLGIYIHQEKVTNALYVLKVFEKGNFNGYQEIEFRKMAILSAEPEIGTIYGLVNVLDGETQLVGYLMEYIRGSTLEEIVNSETQLNLDEYYSIITEVATGMEKSHHYGIIHHDLTLRNVMIDGFGNIKIIDFFWDQIGETKTKDVNNFKAIAQTLFEKLSGINRKHAEIINAFCHSINSFKGCGQAIDNLKELSFELGFLTPKGRQIVAYLLNSKEAQINAQTHWMFDEPQCTKRFFPEVTQEDIDFARTSEQVHHEMVKKRIFAIEKRVKLHFDALLEQLNQCELLNYRIKVSTDYGLRGPYTVIVFITFRIKLLKWIRLNRQFKFMEPAPIEQDILNAITTEDWAAALFD